VRVPGWYYDGCGDYRCHDGHESHSVAQRDLRTRAEAAEARLAEARKVLRSVEWHGSRWVGSETCPECSRERMSYPKDPPAGHAPDCRLRAVLGDGDGR